MKIVILFSFLTLSWSHHQLSKIPFKKLNAWNELMSPFRNECMTASGAEPSDTLDFFKNAHFPDKASFKCYLKCIYLRLHFMDANGVVDTEEIASKSEGVNIEIVKECELAVRDVTDLCEKVYSGILCAVEKLSKNQ